MTLNVGDRLGGKYRIVRRIGAGGMGTVYEAQHEGLRTRVAIKMLLPQLCRAATLADRFLREARVSAALESPHVIRVTDVDQSEEGVPYLVMELLEGESLQERLATEGRLGTSEALEITRQILTGLECAHEAGVVHRDLKPDNAFLTGPPDARIVKLLDFGIAKVRASSEYQALTRPGTAMGTPEYMPPEQAFSAAEADERSDLYSVGVMLYEMLSGRLPADGDTPQQIARQVIAGSVPPLDTLCPDLPPELVRVVHRAIAATPDGRPRSAREMREALSAHQPGAAAGPASAPALAGTEQMSEFHLPTPAASPAGASARGGGTAPLPAAAAVGAAGADGGAHGEGGVARTLGATAAGLGEKPPIVASTRPVAAVAAKRPSRWPWLALPLVLLALLAGGAALLLLRQPDPGPPPPRPVPRLSAQKPHPRYGASRAPRAAPTERRPGQTATRENCEKPVRNTGWMLFQSATPEPPIARYGSASCRPTAARGRGSSERRCPIAMAGATPTRTSPATRKSPPLATVHRCGWGSSTLPTT